MFGNRLGERFYAVSGIDLFAKRTRTTRHEELVACKRTNQHQQQDKQPQQHWTLKDA